MILDDFVSLAVVMTTNWCSSGGRSQSSLSCTCSGELPKFDLPRPPGSGDTMMMSWKAFIIAAAILAGAVVITLVVILIIIIYRRCKNSKQTKVVKRSHLYAAGSDDISTTIATNHTDVDNGMKMDNPIFNPTDSSLSDQENTSSSKNGRGSGMMNDLDTPHFQGNGKSDGGIVDKSDNRHQSKNSRTLNDSQNNGNIQEDFPLNTNPSSSRQEDVDSLESGFAHADSGMLWRKQNWQLGVKNSAFL
ncbi:uncharacterized protein LOC144451310 [Glandiceps talaboti]